MFVRINTKINTTIFNLLLTSIEDKIVLFNTLLKSSLKDINSTGKEEEPTFLAGVGVLPAQDSNWFKASAMSRNLLYNDIIGIRRDNNFEEPMFKSKIFNQRLITTRLTDKQTKSLTNKATISVVESKTGTLLKKYHKPELKSLGQNVKIKDGSYDEDEYQEIRRNTLLVLHGHPTVKRKDNKFLSPILTDVDHLLIIEGTCTLSEITDILDIYNKIGSNGIYRIHGLSEMFDVLPSMDVTLSLIRKYGIEVPTIIGQFEDGIRYSKTDNPRYDLMENTSLFYENGDNKKLKNDELNVFIPFKLYLFLTKSKPLFNDLSQITTEAVSISTPKSLTVNRTPADIGYPKTLNKNNIYASHTDYMKAQTTDNLLPELTTDNHKLKNNITYIPSSFTQRLLKSKLKAMEDRTMVLSEQGDKLYNIPKSILDGDYMSCFHFFTTEQTKAIDKAKLTSERFFFNVFPEKMINLSYYTNNIQNRLLNRFAGDMYKSSYKISDFIYYPRILIEKLPVLDTLLTDLEATQKALAGTFNTDKFTLLTKEMFAYEKANLLAIYLLRKFVDLSLGLGYNYPQFTKGVVETIKANGWHFTKNVLSSYEGNLTFMFIGNSRKAYFLEALYIMCLNSTNTEIVKLIEDALKSAYLQLDTKLRAVKYRIKIASIIKKFLQRTNGNIDGVHYHTSSYFDTIYKDSMSTNRIYFPISQEKASDLIPLILVETKVINYVKGIGKELDYFLHLLGHSGENYPVVNDKVIIPFLDSEEKQKQLFNKIRRGWYSDGEKDNIKYPILFKTLRESAVAKNTDLAVFMDMFISNYTDYYVCSIKTVE